MMYDILKVEPRYCRFCGNILQMDPPRLEPLATVIRFHPITGFVQVTESGVRTLKCTTEGHDSWRWAPIDEVWWSEKK